MTLNEKTANHWGPIRLQPGVGRNNMTIYVLGYVFVMLFSTFVPQAQPFILTEMLHIPESQQGVLSGSLGLAATLVGLIMPSIWGTLSDKTGRRLVYALGLLISASGIFLYPLAGSVVFLYLFRMLFQAGSNASHTMSNALLADYIDNKDRGKAIGITAMCGGVGALLTVFIFLRLPDLFARNGTSLQNAGRFTFWIMTGLGILAALMVGFGLMGKSKKQAEEKRTVLQIARAALQAARQDAGISLAYGVNFVASGAVTVVGTFFTLWIVTYGTAQAGLTSVQALARAGMIMGISQMMGLVASPLFGILADRISRVLAVVIATGLTAIIFAATIFITNPLSGGMIVLGLLIGFVQISGVLTGGALIAQQAPPAVRGSVMGFYGFCGALGTMLTSVLGGFLFDRVSGQAPFVLTACLCVIIVIWGLIIQSKSTRKKIS